MYGDAPRYEAYNPRVLLELHSLVYHWRDRAMHVVVCDALGTGALSVYYVA